MHACACRSNHEQALIESFLNSTHKMLEWGSGYSTLWFSQFVDKYYAIEHDRTWHQTIAANLSALPNVELTLAAVEKGYKVTCSYKGFPSSTQARDSGF